MGEGAPDRGTRKTRTGRVIGGGKMDKTVIVMVEFKRRHPMYGKEVKHRKKLYVHDEKNEAKTGDLVSIVETRPLSRLKRWRLLSVLEHVAVESEQQ